MYWKDQLRRMKVQVDTFSETILEYNQDQMPQ